MVQTSPPLHFEKKKKEKKKPNLVALPAVLKAQTWIFIHFIMDSEDVFIPQRSVTRPQSQPENFTAQ